MMGALLVAFLLAHEGHASTVPTVTCSFTIDNYVTGIWVDGVDMSSSVSPQINTGSWGTLKTLTFDDTAKVLAIKGNDNEQGCPNGGLAIQCTSQDPDSSWNMDSGADRDSFLVAGAVGGFVTPATDAAGRSWYDKGYEPSSEFGVPMVGETTYADNVVGVEDICGHERIGGYWHFLFRATGGETDRTNVAAGRPVTSSSAISGYGEISYATDGVTANDLGTGVAHTNAETEAWIEVDFEGNYEIDNVVVWNAWEHCCRGRINPFVVILYDSQHNEVYRTGDLYMDTSVVHEAKQIDMTAYTGTAHYVRVQLVGSSYLHVAEIEAFGSGPVPPPSANCLPDFSFDGTELDADFCPRGWTCSEPYASSGGGCGQYAGVFVGAYNGVLNTCNGCMIPSGVDDDYFFKIAWDNQCGSAVSDPFALPAGAVGATFLIGGGADAGYVKVVRVSDGAELCSFTGAPQCPMARNTCTFDGDYGTTHVYVELAKPCSGSGGWENLVVDDIVFVDAYGSDLNANISCYPAAECASYSIDTMNDFHNLDTSPKISNAVCRVNGVVDGNCGDPLNEADPGFEMHGPGSNVGLFEIVFSGTSAVEITYGRAANWDGDNCPVELMLNDALVDSVPLGQAHVYGDRHTFSVTVSDGDVMQIIEGPDGAVCGVWLYELRICDGPAKNCADVKQRNPDATDGFYTIKPPSSGVTVRANENVDLPSGGVSVYCQFDGVTAWTLVGTFKDGVTDTKWSNGGYDFSQSPQLDDSTSGTTWRFPLGFWNDVAATLPKGAIRHTSTVYESENSDYSYCPGYWKTACQLEDDQKAHTAACAEPYKIYDAQAGTFDELQFDRTSNDGFSDGHGSLLGYGSSSSHQPGAPSLILTGFQGGYPALGKCKKIDGSYVNYAHNRGFFIWIGGFGALATETESWSLVMKLKAGSDVFDYESAYWTDDQVLNPASTEASPTDDIDAKLNTFMTEPVQRLKVCYNTLDNCYVHPPLDQQYASARDMFGAGFIREDAMNKTAFTNIFLPPGSADYNKFWNGHGGGICGMQRPGVNIQCNDNNHARIGYCVNLPDQGCQQDDSHDADSPIGIGLKTQNWPNAVNAPFGEYAIYGSGEAGVRSYQHQAWLFVCGAVDGCDSGTGGETGPVLTCPAGSYVEAHTDYQLISRIVVTNTGEQDFTGALTGNSGTETCKLSDEEINALIQTTGHEAVIFKVVVDGGADSARYYKFTDASQEYTSDLFDYTHLCGAASEDGPWACGSSKLFDGNTNWNGLASVCNRGLDLSPQGRTCSGDGFHGFANPYHVYDRIVGKHGDAGTIEYFIKGPAGATNEGPSGAGLSVSMVTGSSSDIYPLSTSHGSHVGETLDPLEAFSGKMVLWNHPNSVDPTYKVTFGSPTEVSTVTCEYDAGATVKVLTSAGTELGSTSCYESNGSNRNTCTITIPSTTQSELRIVIDSHHGTWNWMGNFKLFSASGADITTALASTSEPPTPGPTSSPTQPPSPGPTSSPTQPPSPGPTTSPTQPPSASPTVPPTQSPTVPPTAPPTPGPTSSPTAPPTPGPTSSPTEPPSPSPTSSPTAPPTPGPTSSPTTASPTATVFCLCPNGVGSESNFYGDSGCAECASCDEDYELENLRCVKAESSSVTAKAEKVKDDAVDYATENYILIAVIISVLCLIGNNPGRFCSCCGRFCEWSRRRGAGFQPFEDVGEEDEQDTADAEMMEHESGALIKTREASPNTAMP